MAWPLRYISHYNARYKYSKRTRNVLGAFLILTEQIIITIETGSNACIEIETHALFFLVNMASGMNCWRVLSTTRRRR